MEIVLGLLLGLVAAAIVYAVFFRRKEPQDGSLLLIQNQINEINRMIDSRLGDFSKFSQTQIGENSKIVREVTEKLTKLDETNKQVVNFADQLRGLQDILKNPKQRGVLGEYYLETVLGNVLSPKSFEIQHKFSNGEIVDAVIFYGDKIIPVDSKFSLENYNRLIEAKTPEERKKMEDLLRADLKGRIDETAKYVRPAEGTIEFAFMFIPSEALYYDLLINKVGSITARDLVEYAVYEKRVIIVSPTSLLAYLQTVIQGLRQIEFNKSAESIRKNVIELGRRLTEYEKYIRDVGTHLGQTVGSYNKGYAKLKMIDKDVVKIGGESMKMEPPVLEAPHEEADDL
ncbi:MAG: DNA recombination protein RmuC [Patescibacteria group bacterium]|nr:DNA recombination protein RmuC [Patescibacteria group bacterium]